MVVRKVGDSEVLLVVRQYYVTFILLLRQGCLAVVQVM